VNSHSGGTRPTPAFPRRDLTARAQRTSLSSMQPPSPTIAEALASIQARIAAALAAAGRAPGGAHLVAVSKTHPAEAVQAAIDAGQRLFGENRVQEAAAKFPALRAGCPDLRLHLIGGLQTNKARDAVRMADTIESLDRPRLADAIADAIQKEGRTPGLLIQVNIGDEPQKAGIPTAEADAFIEACTRRFGPALLGLMCIPPAETDPVPFFRSLAVLARRHALTTLSMGMSGDFEIAIAQGATHVRVGSAIFGARPAVGPA
jgi:pyridoxal phosphate enzyme (YggS family)